MTATYYRERILSMWGALCTASRMCPDSFLVGYWSRNLAHLGNAYAAATHAN
jgi:hypothetical protein